MTDSRTSLPSLPPSLPSSPPPLSVPLAVALTICSSLLGSGIAWGALQGQVTRNHEAIAELHATFERHREEPGHAVELQRLSTIDHSLDVLERKAEEARVIREDVSRIRDNVAALCRASRVANCAP